MGTEEFALIKGSIFSHQLGILFTGEFIYLVFFHPDILKSLHLHRLRTRGYIPSDFKTIPKFNKENKKPIENPQ